MSENDNRPTASPSSDLPIRQPSTPRDPFYALPQHVSQETLSDRIARAAVELASPRHAPTDPELRRSGLNTPDESHNSLGRLDHFTGAVIATDGREGHEPKGATHVQGANDPVASIGNLLIDGEVPRFVGGLMGGKSDFVRNPSGDTSATLRYDRVETIPGIDRSYTHGEEVTVKVERNGDIDITSQRMVGRAANGQIANGIPPEVVVKADGRVMVGNQYIDGFAPETAQRIRDAVADWMKDGKLDPQEAELANQFALNATDMVFSERNRNNTGPAADVSGGSGQKRGGSSR